MLVPSQAALLRGSQDIALLRGSQDAGPRAPQASPHAAATLPELGEGQHVPQPGTITFRDFLSALNPLQHLPLVGTIYRAVTGETLVPAMRVAGGFLMGGPVGAIASAVGAAAEEIFQAARRGPHDVQPAEQLPATAAGDDGERLARIRAATAAYGRAAPGAPATP
jgi:hypothetical protein